MKCMNNCLVLVFLLLYLNSFATQSDDMGDMGDSINWVIKICIKILDSYKFWINYSLLFK